MNNIELKFQPDDPIFLLYMEKRHKKDYVCPFCNGDNKFINSKGIVLECGKCFRGSITKDLELYVVKQLTVKYSRFIFTNLQDWEPNCEEAVIKEYYDDFDRAGSNEVCITEYYGKTLFKTLEKATEEANKRNEELIKQYELQPST